MAVIVLANWAIHRFGFIPVGFGLVAPAGTYFAGAAFVFRDFIQLNLGRLPVVIAIVAGSLLTLLISPSLALASGTAFLVGELADFGVFTPIADRGHIVAGFTLANTVGLLTDTWLFLFLAFGSIAHWQGTVVGKLWVTAAFLPVVWAVRKRYGRPAPA
jgi:queuosine precursor transporter